MFNPELMTSMGLILRTESKYGNSKDHSSVPPLFSLPVTTCFEFILLGKERVLVPLRDGMLCSNALELHESDHFTLLDNASLSIYETEPIIQDSWIFSQTFLTFAIIGRGYDDSCKYRSEKDFQEINVCHDTLGLLNSHRRVRPSSDNWASILENHLANPFIMTPQVTKPSYPIRLLCQQ